MDEGWKVVDGGRMLGIGEEKRAELRTVLILVRESVVEKRV